MEDENVKVVQSWAGALENTLPLSYVNGVKFVQCWIYLPNGEPLTLVKIKSAAIDSMIESDWAYFPIVYKAPPFDGQSMAVQLTESCPPEILGRLQKLILPNTEAKGPRSGPH